MSGHSHNMRKKHRSLAPPTTPQPSVAVVVGLKRIAAKWLTSHCPQARSLIAARLVQQDWLEHAATAHAAAHRPLFVVIVETASGQQVGRFEFANASTTVHVSTCVGINAPSFPASQQVLCRLGDIDGGLLSRTATLREVCQLTTWSSGKSIAASTTTTTTTTTTLELVVMLTITWDKRLSSDGLMFSNNGRTVSRDCFTNGAAMSARSVASIELRAAGDAFGVVLETLVPSMNTVLSVGVTTKPTFDMEKLEWGQPVIGEVGGTAELAMISLTTRHRHERLGFYSRSSCGIDALKEGDCVHFRLARCSSGGDLRWSLQMLVNGIFRGGHVIRLPAEFSPPLRPVAMVSYNSTLTLVP